MFFSSFYVALAALLNTVAAVPASPRALVRRQSSVPLPANDPFYTPPAGFENQPPGAVLRYRTVSASFFSDIPDPVSAWQILYRTTAVNGSAISTVTTVFKPLISYLDRFVSYATAYDSSATQCDPSYAYRLGSDSSDNLDTDLEFLIIEGYLLQGYIVASPDYEGPDAAFIPGHLEGMCVLDNMRAVTNFGDTIGFSTATPAIVGQGYSGGAVASGWAASLQSSYAPELNIVGWAHGGTPANLTAVVYQIDDTEWAGFLPAAIAGLTAPSAYGAELQPVLNSILTSQGQTALAYAQSHCMDSDLTEFAFFDLFSTEYQTLGPNVLQQPTIQQIFAANLMGGNSSETPVVPVLVYHALQDEIIPYAQAAALVSRWCDRGASVTFTTYGEGGHVTTAVVSIFEVYAFVADAFKGSIASGCSTNSVLTTTLNPIGFIVELEPIISKLIEYLGRLTKGD